MATNLDRGGGLSNSNLQAGGGGSGGGGGGGGGIVFRDPPDEFTGASLTACRTNRDTFFDAAGNSDALGEFQDNQSLGIILNPTSSTDNEFETYLPGNDAGDAHDNTQWVERTDAVQGTPGDDGDDGTVTEVRFSISTDDTAPVVTSTAAGWSTTPVTMDAANTYLWRIFRSGLPGALPNWNTITPQLIGRWGGDGADGDDGDDGAGGQYVIYAYQNATERPTAPTGGSHDVDTGVTTPPTGWTVAPTDPPVWRKHLFRSRHYPPLYSNR